MFIKSSTALRNDYNAISFLAHEKSEPIFITKNGEGDLVVMSIETYEKREKMLTERTCILDAEASRLAGESSFSVEEIRNRLEKKYQNA